MPADEIPSALTRSWNSRERSSIAWKSTSFIATAAGTAYPAAACRKPEGSILYFEIQLNMKRKATALTTITAQTPAPIVLPLVTPAPTVLPLVMVAMAHLRATRSPYLVLDEPNALAPFVFAEEHAAELGEAGGRVVEGADDRLALRKGQREHLRLEVVGLLEPLADVVEERPTTFGTFVAGSSSGRGRRQGYRTG